MLDREGGPLRDRLIEIMSAGLEPLDQVAFDDLARQVFSYNVRHVAAYGAYCEARGRTPETVGTWTEIPAVPTAAFKDMALVASGSTVDCVFRTSGTTRGTEQRGEHHVVDLALYRASLRPTFRGFLLPDYARVPFLSLVPPHGSTPDSSLAFMVSDVVDHFGAEGSQVLADTTGIEFERLDEAARAAEVSGQPVLLIGTSAAFIHWLDRLTSSGRSYALPAGSRLMDTGGFKGGGRSVDPHELRQAYRRSLELPPSACVNEYGMTEMLSQFYDTALRDAVTGVRRPARKAGPPWVRSVAVDPETLEPLPAGRTGLLRHMDLANLGSIAAIQTEDLGRVDDDGIVLEGRMAAAQPRGCSIAMDLLLGGTG
jgi:hypothetical protein